MLMDKTGTRTVREIDIGSAVFAIRAVGSLQVEYKLAVATRNGRVHILNNGEFQPGAAIQLDAFATDVYATSAGLTIACMNDTLVRCAIGLCLPSGRLLSPLILGCCPISRPATTGAVHGRGPSSCRPPLSAWMACGPLRPTTASRSWWLGWRMGPW